MDDLVHRREPPGPALGPVDPESRWREGDPAASTRPSRVTEEWSVIIDGRTPDAGPDKEAELRELTRHVQQIPLLAVHGFHMIATLEDGARIFNRRPDLGPQRSSERIGLANDPRRLSRHRAAPRHRRRDCSDRQRDVVRPTQPRHG
jgi:hypothetical protein